MDIDAIHKGKGKYNSYKGKGKGKGRNKGKGYGGHNGYGYDCHSEEATKEIKDSAKDTTKEKERTKENKQQIHVTDVEEQDTMPKTAEWQYTTLDKEKAMTLRTRQHNGTTTTMTMDGTFRTTHDNSRHNSHWHFHQFHPQATMI